MQKRHKAFESCPRKHINLRRLKPFCCLQILEIWKLLATCDSLQFTCRQFNLIPLPGLASWLDSFLGHRRIIIFIASPCLCVCKTCTNGTITKLQMNSIELNGIVSNRIPFGCMLFVKREQREKESKAREISFFVFILNSFLQFNLAFNCKLNCVFVQVFLCACLYLCERASEWAFSICVCFQNLRH